MKLAIMQPYFLPYIGYFQLMHSVDKFVVYDNIQFTKKGWINRNRMLLNGRDDLFSLSLKKDSDYLNVNQRFLSDNFKEDRLKLKRKIHAAYNKAPYFNEIFPIVESIVEFNETNLFDYIFNSMVILKNHLGLSTELIKSSSFDFDIEDYKGQDKVLEICKQLKAEVYVNAIGGMTLYSKDDFIQNNIKLVFVQSKPISYKQFENEFVPWLSMIDVMMFNDKQTITSMLSSYDLV